MSASTNGILSCHVGATCILSARKSYIRNNPKPINPADSIVPNMANSKIPDKFLKKAFLFMLYDEANIIGGKKNSKNKPEKLDISSLLILVYPAKRPKPPTHMPMNIEIA
mmetsp:Transcript_3832/g.5152  ORF Transcript_3832/g.5152 Transcript_3832/m.5152 type:complete len:110 (-) Transcript_3832:116-445(-)